MATPGNFLLVMSFVFGYFYIADAQTKSPLRVSAILESPYLMVEQEETDKKYVGFLPDLLDKLNLTYTISLTPDGQYGKLHENGSWAGMVGQLLTGKADISGLLTVVTPRSNVIDLSYPVMPVRLSVVVSKPGVRTNSALTRLLDPFDFSVWIMAVVVFCVTGTVLYIIMRFNPYEWRRMSRDKEATVREGESFTCLNSFFFITSTLMWQGYGQAPRSIGARVLVVAWWIFTIILIVTYTANFTNLCRTGFSTRVNERDLPINSISDVANKHIRAGFLQGGATSKFFRESKSSDYQKVYKKVINDEKYDEFKSVRFLIEQIRRNKFDNAFAAIFESPTSKYIVNRKPCDLLEFTEDLTHSYIALGLQRGSSLTDYINIALVRLTETGQIQELRRKWFESKGECPSVPPAARGERPQFYQLNLATFTLAIIIVVLGIVLGLIISLVEFCVYKRTKSRTKDDEAKPMTGEETCNKTDEEQQGVTPAV